MCELPKNHKTVFVLDHTPYFSIPSEQQFDFDFLKRGITGKISKTLWTCAVEAAIEYCRIGWDLFLQEKLIRFIVSDNVAQILNTWSVHQQNLAHMINAFGMVGVPTRNATPGVDCSVIHGLRAAIDCLAEYTEAQDELVKKSVTNNISNSCRIICITSARDNASIKRLEEIFLNCLIQQNDLAPTQEDTMAISHCHFLVLNIYPCNIESQVTSHRPTELSPILTVEVHSIRASELHSKLSHLILNHYGLASTTVTGIPMKEEQNASSSANYDVEIFHLSSTHTLMQYEDMSLIKTKKEGTEYDTITLKWCTPRGSTSSDFHNCVEINRITPVDVNSRPSSCLINFLLNGRLVMLEMPRKQGGKIISHYLVAHNGEIYIHSLCTSRSVIEDPPSISEGVGGRVADYRITDFAAFIQKHKLVFLKNANPKNLDRIKLQLERHTNYWPLTISSTILYNHVEPLITLLVKDSLTEYEVIQCKHIIHSLINSENKNEALNIPNSYRIKYQKREEQYKILWSEIETFIKSNLHSDGHLAIYNCFKELHKQSIQSPDEITIVNKCDDGTSASRITTTTATTSTITITGSMNEPIHHVSVIRATTDSPLSPPSITSNASIKEKQTIFEALLSQRKIVTRSSFHGLQHGSDSFYKLYPNLNTEDNNSKENGMVIDN